MVTNGRSDGSKQIRAALAILLAITCYFALFWRLDGTNLWRDEATTSVWARTMANTNSLTPYVFDGKTVAVQGFDAHDFNDHLTPGMQGWLQFYVAALSFKLFGVSEFTARFPFAFVGLLSVCVMWLIGRRLYGDSNLVFVFPFLTVTSIWFLTAARQARYYGLVFFFGSLLLYEFIRLLQSRELSSRWSWYLRVSLWSAGVYLSNYLAFAGMYFALCVFVLLLADSKLFWRWSLLTVILGVIFGAEFFAFHFDFASAWGSAPQPWEDPNATFLDKFRSARNMHAEELFRMLPLLFLVPGVFYVLRRDVLGRDQATLPAWPLAVCALLAVLLVCAKGTEVMTWSTIAVELLALGLLLRYFQMLRRERPGAVECVRRMTWAIPLAISAVLVFGFGVNRSDDTRLLQLAAELIFAGLLVFAVIRLRPKPGREFPLLNGVVLLATLVIGLSVLVTIFVGLDKGLPRYYYQVLAGAIVLTGVVAAELLRRNKAAGAMFLASVLIWPNLAYNVNASFSIVERQFAANRVIDYPVLQYLRENTEPGDRIVFYRNVQGMMAHFYLPDRAWVGQLDAENERAEYFRDRLPADAYDDAGDVDWYIVWDNYGKMPKGLDERYEKVWEYTYRYPMPWWDAKRGAKDERTWRVYKRKAASEDAEGKRASGDAAP